MRLADFLNEGIRSSDLRPRTKTPTDTPEGEMQQKIRDAGDVGKREMLQKVTGKPVRNAREFRKAGKEVATKAGAANFGDTQDPVERALAMTAGPAQYQTELGVKADAAAKALGKAPKPLKEPKSKHDARGNISTSYKNYQARQKEIEKYERELAKIDKTRDKDFDDLPAPERQRRQVDANRPRGRLSLQGEVEDALDAATKLSAEPEAREPIMIKTDVELPKELRADPKDPYTLAVPDSPEASHRFQRSGMGIGDPKEDPDYVPGTKRDSKKLSDADFDELIAGSLDPETAGAQLDPTALQSKSGKDADRTQIPTPRDLDQVFRSNQEYETALDNEDAAAIQKTIFTKKVSDEDVNKMISRFDAQGKDNKALLQKFKTSGLGEGRDKAAYAGDIFDGPVPEEFRAKKKVNGKWVIDDEITETDIVDLDALKKGDPELYDRAFNNRGFEAIRTWMKQAGVDVYAPHEGIRSIADMDLEHLRALQSSQPDGNGKDHPYNWAWGSASANRRRGNRPLTDMSRDLDIGREETTYDKGEVLNTYNDFITSTLGERPRGAAGKDWDALKKELESELGGKPTSSGGSSIFGASTILNRTKQERKAELDRLVKVVGMSKDQAEKMLGSVETRRLEDTPVQEPFKYGGASRTSGLPRVSNPDLEGDVRTYKRDHRMYRKGQNLLKQIPKFKGMNNEQIKSSKEFRQLRDGLVANRRSEVADGPAAAEVQAVALDEI